MGIIHPKYRELIALSWYCQGPLVSRIVTLRTRAFSQSTNSCLASSNKRIDKSDDRSTLIELGFRCPTHWSISIEVSESGRSRFTLYSDDGISPRASVAGTISPTDVSSMHA